MIEEIATKMCTSCKQTFFKTLFPSLKGSECQECMRERNKKYQKQFGRDPKRRWTNGRLFDKNPNAFEWERHLHLKKIT